MAAPKPNQVEIWLFKGKAMFLKKVNGKVFGGIVSFKEADPTRPIVWLGQQSYTIYNASNKKSILFFDTLNGMLFKPKDMSTSEDSVDMVMQASQNVLLAGKESKNALGIEEAKSTLTPIILGLAVIMFLIFFVFVYLVIGKVPSSGSTAVTTISGLGGPSIVPQTNRQESHQGISTIQTTVNQSRYGVVK